MNQAEFDALKPGDKVRNAQGHEATVADVGEYGVRVQWGGNGPLFTLYRQGRIWVTMDIVPPVNEQFDAYGADEDGKHT